MQSGEGLGGKGYANLNCLIKPDDKYISSTEETLELLLEEHFPDSVKQESVGHGPRERIDLYEPHWSLAAKTSSPDDVYSILLTKGLYIILAPITELLRASVVLRMLPKEWCESRIADLSKSGLKRHFKFNKLRLKKVGKTNG